MILAAVGTEASWRKSYSWAPQLWLFLRDTPWHARSWLDASSMHTQPTTGCSASTSEPVRCADPRILLKVPLLHSDNLWTVSWLAQQLTATQAPVC